MITGNHYLGEVLDHTILDSNWHKIVGDANLFASNAPHFPAGNGAIWRLFEKAPFNSNELSAWLGDDDPTTSARRLANHLHADLQIVASVRGRKVAMDGPFNEVGHGVKYAQFCFEFAKILWQEYGLLLAAFASSTGSYNEPEHAEVMATHYIKPCLDASIPCYLSLHAYASLYPPVWHGPNRQFPHIQAIWDSGAQGDIFGLNDFLHPVLLDVPQAPPTYTGFGWMRLMWHLKNNEGIDLKRVGFLFTESGLVDNVGDPGIGAVAGGWLEWVRKGLWDKLRIGDDSYEMVAARGLLYIEQQCRLFAPYVMDMGAMPFTYTDQNKGSRWHLVYRVIDVIPLFKQLAASLPDTPPPPVLKSCEVATLGADNVNIRNTPIVANDNRIGSLTPGETRLATHQTTNRLDEVWYRLGNGGWVRSDVVRLGQPCNLPQWRGLEPSMNIVLRDHSPAQLKAVVPKFGGDVFVHLGDPPDAVAAATGLDFITKIWYQQGEANSDNFFEHVAGSARHIVDNVLLQYPILKNFINDHQRGHWQGGAVNEYTWVLNDAYTPEAVIELPINGDKVPQQNLGLFFAASALFAERLNHYTDPATTRPAERLLMGCFINRDIALDADRGLFWTMAQNSGLLNKLVELGGYIQLRRKYEGDLSDFKRSSIFPDNDLKWLRDNGFGSIPVLFVIEWVDGYRNWIGPDNAAQNLWLIDQTTRSIAGLHTAVMLRQTSSSGDWGDGHDLRDIEDIYIAYRDGSPPDIDWQPEDTTPPPPGPDPNGGCSPLATLADALARLVNA